MPTKSKKSEIVAVRVTPEVRKALEKRAAEGFRSVSQEVEMILAKALKSGKK